MPSKNSIKDYVANGYYHLYNRGVEKRKIFLNSQDYGVFLSYLKEYLIPKNIDELRERLDDENLSYRERDKILKLIRLNNFADEIKLIAYCLMPNHFHFLIKQNNNPYAIGSFINSLGTRYTSYFNRKYKRIGPLYQGVYKAVQVTYDEQFLHLSRYIHQQALDLQGDSLQGGQPSSYLDFIGLRKTEWVHPEEILDYFSKTNPKFPYGNFINKSRSKELIFKFLLED